MMCDGEETSEASLMSHLFYFDLDEILQKIFLLLCPASLHKSRQVCHQWNNFIVRRIWGCRFGRGEMEKKLQQRWRNSAPKETATSGIIVNAHDCLM